jgi:hypothetical protein
LPGFGRNFNRQVEKVEKVERREGKKRRFILRRVNFFDFFDAAAVPPRRLSRFFHKNFS